jgi:hypothetical protein
MPVRQSGYEFSIYATTPSALIGASPIVNYWSPRLLLGSKPATRKGEASNGNLPGRTPIKNRVDTMFLNLHVEVPGVWAAEGKFRMPVIAV